MKTFIALFAFVCIQSSVHGKPKPKPAPKSEAECIAACNEEFTKPYRECMGSTACQLYVSNEAKRCILKCEGQSGE